MKCRDGRIIDVLLSSTPMDRDDLSKGVTFTALDITEKKRAEAALRESEEKYKSMMEAMKDSVYICSQDYRVEYMNPSMIKRTGRDATGEHCFKALQDLDRKCPWCLNDKTSANEDVELDIVEILRTIVPQKRSYKHMEGNSDAHVKASLVGFSTEVLLHKGKMILGTWQGIMFCEFDGPRNRNFYVQVQGE